MTLRYFLKDAWHKRIVSNWERHGGYAHPLHFTSEWLCWLFNEFCEAHPLFFGYDYLLIDVLLVKDWGVDNVVK